jgi:hypothetical protein
MEENLPDYNREWFLENRPATGSAFGFTETITRLASNVLFVGIGTGILAQSVEIPKEPLHQYHNLHVPMPNSPETPQAVSETPVVSPRLQIERIREVFSPAVSNIALTFGVSRQAIYNWINDESPDPAHLGKLDDLYRAAEIIAGSGFPMTGWLLKRKVFDGKSLFEWVRNGGSAQEAANQLVFILKTEAEQRKEMDKRLAGTRRSFRSAESDFPAENDVKEQ